jgi:hypothetical protein
MLSLVHPKDRFQPRLVATFIDFALTRMRQTMPGRESPAIAAREGAA